MSNIDTTKLHDLLFRSSNLAYIEIFAIIDEFDRLSKFEKDIKNIVWFQTTDENCIAALANAFTTFGNVWGKLASNNPELAKNEEDTATAMLKEIDKLLSIAYRATKDAHNKDGFEEQATAWVKVWFQLLKHNPNTFTLTGEMSSEDSAVAEIKRLQSLDVKRHYLVEKADAWDKLMDVFERVEPNAYFSTWNDVVPMIEKWFHNQAKPVNDVFSVPMANGTSSADAIKTMYAIMDDKTTQPASTSDRELLKECLRVIKTRDALITPNYKSTFGQKLENHLLLNEEQFAKPEDYGRLLAFADRVSSTIWGGSSAWCSLEVDGRDGLKQLSDAVIDLQRLLRDKQKTENFLKDRMEEVYDILGEYLEKDCAEDEEEEDDDDIGADYYDEYYDDECK